ncbi:hypothetical protein ACQJBY_041734 [Aegilops geniculata]
MAPGGLVLLGLLLLVLVDAPAAVHIDIAAALFHSHDHLGGNKKKDKQSSSSSSSPSWPSWPDGNAATYLPPPAKKDKKEKPSWPDGNAADFFAEAAKKGLRSFTGGRGGYKTMTTEFLDAHNQVRAKYGVPPLRWSKKLARYARRWSDARRFDCVMMHSVGSPYGENVFWGTGWDWKAVEAVGDWASESSFYDWRAQACHPGQVCEHFTQIVWRTTNYVGCGRAECLAGGVFITCSYDPPGNWKGEVPLT